MCSTTDHTQFFGRIRLHGITKSPSGEPCPVVLERWPSFPMPTEIVLHDVPRLTSDDIRDLSSRPLSPLFEIEARVRFDAGKGKGNATLLGQGLTGLVYPLEIVSVHCLSDSGHNHQDGVNCVPPDLPPLCVKLASPGYARSLAREAWFYEQLDSYGMTRIMTPRCYGVFHTSLGNCKSAEAITINIPRYDYYYAASRPIGKYSNIFTSRMIEECSADAAGKFKMGGEYVDDIKGSSVSSPWRSFTESPQTTTLTVMLMDMLGDIMTVKDFDDDLAEGITQLYEHLGPLLIFHEDDRFPNILRVPPHLRVECPTHKRAHEWNFIDWGNAIEVCRCEDHVFLAKLQRDELAYYYDGQGGTNKDIFMPLK